MALEALRGRSNVLMQSAAASSGDALWAALPDLHNVGISGATLELTVGTVSQDLCARIANRIDAGAMKVSNLVVRNDDGTRVFRCTVQRLDGVILKPIDYQPNAAAAPAIPTGAPLIINAAGPNRDQQAKAAAKLRADAEGQYLQIATISMQAGTATIYYSNSRYQVEAEAIDKLLRVAMADAPPYIEQFRFIAIRDGKPQAEYNILRATAERNFEQEGIYDLLANNSGPTPTSMSAPALDAANRKTYPRLSWTIFPQVRQEFFDPNNPLGVQVVAGAAAALEILPGLSLHGEIEASLFDTFYSARLSDSVLPHVRTDFLQYFRHGKNGIGDLMANYRFRVAPTVFASIRAGYLESMFAGVGGEILWRPEGQRWALGADLYEVKQRGYNRLFDFLPYRQTTGHVTLYYDSPWYDLSFQLRAGQYLAGDRGVTVQVSRRFSTGFEVGVFATKTNVSAAQFGEGSFDKGFFIHIPLDWVLPTHSQTSLDQMIRIVQRDGGQMLLGDATLFDATRRLSEADAHLLKWN
jgi:hypothetical protein